jgi:hypothetical protein
MLDPLVRRLAARGPKRPPLDRTMLAAGAALMLSGIALVVTLRRVLLVREVPPADADRVMAALGGNLHLTLATNWDAMMRAFTFSPQAGFQFVVPLFLLASALLAVRLLLADPARFGALGVVMLAMIASFLCFGLTFETRVLFPLVPFVAMHGWAVWKPRETA